MHGRQHLRVGKQPLHDAGQLILRAGHPRAASVAAGGTGHRRPGRRRRLAARPRGGGRRGRGDCEGVGEEEVVARRRLGAVGEEGCEGPLGGPAGRG